MNRQYLSFTGVFTFRNLNLSVLPTLPETPTEEITSEQAATIKPNEAEPTDEQMPPSDPEPTPATPKEAQSQSRPQAQEAEHD